MWVNHVKDTEYYTYTPDLTLKLLQFAHRVYLGVLYDSQNKQHLLPIKTLIQKVKYTSPDFIFRSTCGSCESCQSETLVYHFQVMVALCFHSRHFCHPLDMYCQNLYLLLEMCFLILVCNHIICFVGNFGNMNFCMLGFWNLCIQLLLSAGLMMFSFCILYLVTLKQNFKNVISYIYTFIALVKSYVEKNYYCLIWPVTWFEFRSVSNFLQNCPKQCWCS